GVTGGGELAAQGLDDLLSQTSELLDPVRAGRAARDGQQADRTGSGEAADGRVQATVGSGYQLTALRLDPRMMRLDSETLCEHIVEAVNAAVADLRGQGTPDGVEAPAGGTPGPSRPPDPPPTPPGRPRGQGRHTARDAPGRRVGGHGRDKPGTCGRDPPLEGVSRPEVALGQSAVQREGPRRWAERLTARPAGKGDPRQRRLVADAR